MDRDPHGEGMRSLSVYFICLQTIKGNNKKGEKQIAPLHRLEKEFLYRIADKI